MYKILLVEDDKDIIELISDYFAAKSDGSIVIDTAENGQTGTEKAYENSYDLLLLDVMLPELDGFEICKEVRRDSDVPIIFITARASEQDMLTGYALGCDDYIVKPFLLSVLFEKANALIKRSKGLVRLPQFYLSSLTLNPNNGKVFSGGVEVALTAKEFAILKILFENKNKIITRDKIITKLWGYDADIDERIIDSHIKNLRKALGENARLIKTVRSRGYVLEE